jgi:hypothetical protein
MLEELTKVSIEPASTTPAQPTDIGRPRRAWPLMSISV